MQPAECIPRRQSGKLLGGKLADTENLFFHSVLGKTLNTGLIYSDTTLSYKQYIFQNGQFHRHSIHKSKLSFNSLINKRISLIKSLEIFLECSSVRSSSLLHTLNEPNWGMF
jgi:hypothetical protein